METDAPIGQEIAIPQTGELLPLDAPSDQLAEAVARMRDLEKELSRVRGIVGGELARRLDLENMRSVRVDNFKIKVGAPGVDWNTDQLAGVLDELVEEASLTTGAMDRIVFLERKVSIRELNKLLPNLNPEQAARVRACSTPSKRARVASVEVV